MQHQLEVDQIVLLAAAVIVAGVVVASLAGRLRVPSLLVFMVLGMVLADDGLGVVHFADAELAQSVSVVALVLILFEGGLSLTWREARPVLAPALVLASAGVVVSAGVVGLAALLLLDVSATTAWLLGGVVASTDAAAVMSVLRGSPVPGRLSVLLEAESGLNDPIAALLTIGILETWAGHGSVANWAVFGVQQVGLGTLTGVAVGLGGAWLAERAHLTGGGLFAVLASGLAGLAYASAAQVGGSGLIAVFLTGMLLGHRLPRHRHALRTVHEGFAFGAQMTVFLLLGLLVFPSDLPQVAGRGLVLVGVLVLVARPLAVLVSLPWFGFSRAELGLLSWVGLRGAVPIVLATFPLTEAYPDARLVFDLVFFVVLLSVAVQGPTIAPLARRLGLAAERRSTATVMGLDHVAADLAELELDDASPVVGCRLEEHPMPPGARVSLIVRGRESVVPDGATVLEAGDVLVVIADQSADLEELLAEWESGAAG
jgi:cell volume regulation protein A